DASFSITYNRAPLAPANARTTDPDTTCTVGAGRPYIRRTTPVLRAVVHDPDGGNVHADFAIVSALNTNVVVWDPGPVPAQGSGAEHAIQVPAGLLHDGGQYRWLVAGLDPQGRSGPITSCEFTVDTTPPPVPKIEAVAGLQATYTADTTSGGIGQTGLFRFGTSGAGDVDRYEYWLTGGPTGSAPADTPQVPVTPTLAGSQTLSARAIDRAGNISPTATFRFTVAFAGISDAWQLDEPSGTTASSVANAGSPLTVSAGVTRDKGVVAVLGGDPGDRALVFDAPGDTAGTSGPVVRTDGSYSVMATVRADQVGPTATAVSQDGTVVSGFELGVSSTGCAPGVSPCWAFSVPSGDGDAAARAVAVSTVPVVPGQWVQLTGMRNASAGTVQLAVCVLGNGDQEGEMVPYLGDAVPAGSSWFASGGFQVGRGKVGGAAGNAWTGAVSQARTYTGVLDIDKLRSACRNPDSIRPVLDPAPPVSPKA
ncbi:LamG domain-containing protein, partial [Cellulomonas iranensis]|uniref:LamG domain-containing protein n=1 Tax=Cellulomonas iranensis TaxID=76862 RepID=UPI0013D5EEF1